MTISLRQGLMFKLLEAIPKNDNDMVVGAKVAWYEDHHEADAVFIDKGYGTGIYSYGVTNGRDWLLVDFGSESADPGCFNKRAEIWNKAKKWLAAGGAIEKDPILRDELLAQQTVERDDGMIQLLSKKAMKKLGARSPNRADGLAISFGHPFEHKTKEQILSTGKQEFATSDYDARNYDNSGTLELAESHYDPRRNI